jgi:hypothetical protein
VQNGELPDKHQKNVIWLKLSDINNVPFFPQSLNPAILQNSSSLPVYLGQID